MNKKATSEVESGNVMSASNPPSIQSFSPAAGLEPYTGPWDWQQAAHLLRRTTYGPTRDEIEWALQAGLSDTIAKLFEDRPLPDPPINYNNDKDPNVPLGETWIEAPYSGLEATELIKRRQSMQAWTMIQYFNSGLCIREKMAFFWHNHFGINSLKEPKYTFSYYSLLQQMAFGNFRELVKQMTIHPHMLRFLNGNQNTKNAPNENYARELLELYTVGKGPQIGPGDYTNYTEEDIFEISRILTGWKNLGYRTKSADDPVASVFIEGDHDNGFKKLSEKFNGAEFENEGIDSYSRLIDVIFEQPNAPYHICRKLYRWFVYYKIDEEIEQNVIQPMADLLVSNNYEIKPVVEALLSSAHFFDFLNVGPMIKAPIEFMVSLYRPLHVVPDDLEGFFDPYFLHNEFFNDLVNRLKFDFFNPPEVAGWKAWYQEPVYYRTWINTLSIQNLFSMIYRVTINGYEEREIFLRVSPMPLLEKMAVPSDPNYVVKYFCDLLLPLPLSGDLVDGSYVNGQYADVKDDLIPGLPDFEWTIEYNDFIANQDDQDKFNLIEDKLIKLLKAILELPEFQLS